MQANISYIVHLLSFKSVWNSVFRHFFVFCVYLTEKNKFCFVLYLDKRAIIDIQYIAECANFDATQPVVKIDVLN